MNQKLKLGIIGSGKLGRIIAEACRNGLLPDYELVGILGRTWEKTQSLAADCSSEECRVAACQSIEELLELKPDYVAEAASVASVKAFAIPILASGSDLILLSIGALADTEFYTSVQDVARTHHSKIHIASGAVGGFDVLRTVTLMAECLSEQQVTARIDTRKGPASLQNTPLFTDNLMTDNQETTVFMGNAAKAIELLPTKVNVAVASALSTAGPQNTSVSITSVPGMAGDDHKITADTDGIHAVVDIYSKTSDIAGWSVVALLQNLVSPIMFY